MNHRLQLTIPPVTEVKDIVLDMMPCIATNAGPDSIRRSVELAENLVSLISRATSDSTTEAVLKTMLCGIIGNRNGANVAVTQSAHHVNSQLPS